MRDTPPCRKGAKGWATRREGRKGKARADAGSKGLDEVGLELVEVGAEDGGLEGVVDELAVLYGADEAGGFKLFHVVGEGGWGDVDAVAHLAAGGGTALGAELLEDLVAARVG